MNRSSNKNNHQSDLTFYACCCAQVIEFEETSTLINNPDSVFSKLLAVMKIAEEDRLQAGKFNSRTERFQSASGSRQDPFVDKDRDFGHTNPTFQCDDA